MLKPTLRLYAGGVGPGQVGIDRRANGSAEAASSGNRTRMGIEPEPKLTTRRIIVQRFDPQGPFGGLLGVLGGYAVLEGLGWTFTPRSARARP